MGLSKKVLIIANVCEVLFINKLFYKLNKNRKKILAYHNVVSDKYYDGKLHLDYSISESDFRTQLKVIKKNCNINLNFDDVSTTQITFDDGYLNQVSKATKILDEYNVKGTVFCAANLVNSEFPLDIERVLYWFSYVKEGIYIINSLNLTLNIQDNNISRKEAFKRVESNITSTYTLANIVEDLDKIYSFDLLQFAGYEERFTGVSTADLDEMKSRGHLVGAHSSKHYNLATMSKKDLIKDIDKCGLFLKEGIYNTSVFCYPYGNRKDIPEEMPKLLEKNKFSLGLSYGNSATDNFEKFYIPRVTLPATGNVAGINFILSGARHFLVFRKLFPKYIVQ